MKRLLLTLRLALEAIFGVMIVLNAPISLIKVVGSGSSTPYILGSIGGIVIGLVIGFLLIRDAMRVGKRLKAQISN